MLIGCPIRPVKVIWLPNMTSWSHLAAQHVQFMSVGCPTSLLHVIKLTIKSSWCHLAVQHVYLTSFGETLSNDNLTIYGDWQSQMISTNVYISFNYLPPFKIILGLQAVGHMFDLYDARILTSMLFRSWFVGGLSYSKMYSNSCNILLLPYWVHTFDSTRTKPSRRASKSATISSSDEK